MLKTWKVEIKDDTRHTTITRVQARHHEEAEKMALLDTGIKFEDVKTMVTSEVKKQEELCEECGHEVSLHEEKYGCDFEGDKDDPDIGKIAWRCGCKAVSK